MRGSLQECSITFRLSERMNDQLAQLADGEGSNVSAVLRRAVEREIAARALAASGTAARPISPNGALGADIAAIIRGAALGDLDCLRFLFHDRLKALMSIEPPTDNSLLIAMELVTFARLVSSHGDPADARRLAGSLCKSASVFRSAGRTAIGDYLMAETLSILEQLAECGDDLAAMCSERLLAKETPDLVERVRDLRSNAKEEEPA